MNVLYVAGDAFRKGLHWFMTLNAQEWLYVLISTVAFGMYCMRGFRSRSGY